MRSRPTHLRLVPSDRADRDLEAIAGPRVHAAPKLVDLGSERRDLGRHRREALPVRLRHRALLVPGHLWLLVVAAIASRFAWVEPEDFR